MTEQRHFTDEEIDTLLQRGSLRVQNDFDDAAPSIIRQLRQRNKELELRFQNAKKVLAGLALTTEEVTATAWHENNVLRERVRELEAAIERGELYMEDGNYTLLADVIRGRAAKNMKEAMLARIQRLITNYENARSGVDNGAFIAKQTAHYIKRELEAVTIDGEES